MNLEILTQAERIQIEEECDVVIDLHQEFRMRGLGILYDLIQDPNPVKQVYERRLEELYKISHNIYKD